MEFVREFAEPEKSKITERHSPIRVCLLEEEEAPMMTEKGDHQGSEMGTSFKEECREVQLGVDRGNSYLISLHAIRW